MGGPEKARALADSLAQTGLSQAVYVGDSLTDVQAFEAVRAGGGLSLSFNGNRDAVNAAEVIMIADNAWPLALLAAILGCGAKQGVLEAGHPGRAAKSRMLVPAGGRGRAHWHGPGGPRV